MRTVFRIFTLLSCMIVPGTLFAESVRIDEIIVTGTSTGMLRSEIPAAVTLITSQDISEKGISNVSDLLREIPGLDVVQPGGTGKQSSVYIRGANSSQTLVLIDGIRANSPTTGLFDFADLSIDNIERIEIIRSPMSTLYGSEAMGGVIQIFTKKGTSTAGTVAFESGSFGTTKESISTGIKKDFYDISLNASRLDTEGFSTIASGSENDSYENTTISSKIGIHRAGRSIGIIAQLTEARTEIDGFDYTTYAASDDLNNRTNRRWSLLGINMVSSHADTWDNNISISGSGDRIEGLDEDTPDNRSNLNTNAATLDWHINIRSTDGKRLTLGYERQDKGGEVASSGGSYRKSLSNNALYLQDSRRLNPSALLLAAIRWDESSLYESAVTYRIGASVNQTSELKWYAHYGTGFKGPSLNDLFWPGFGNPDLKPEKNSGWEIGFEETILSNLLISLTYFDNNFKDLIQWSGTLRNIGEATSRGVEANFDWIMSPSIRLNGNYTYNETEDTKTNSYLLRRPLNKYGATLSIKPSRRSVIDVSYIYTGKRLDFDSDFDGIPETLKAYSKTNVFASYKIRKDTELYGRIENLFDRGYEEALGYGSAGFSTYWGVRFTL
ncbi:MAG: TonB-dependent receptor [Nitrospirae bacterium]|nr:TonB-dependent receptor [Nitrospirota bacterium]